MSTKNPNVRKALRGGLNTKHNGNEINWLSTRTGWIKGKLTPEQKKALRKFLVSSR